MRVVLDANVVIAAFASHGLCDEIFEICVENHEIIWSEHLLEEIRMGFTRKLKMPKSLVENDLLLIKSSGRLEVPVQVPRHSCRDQKGLPVLGLAAATGADFIITGDEDLLVLKKFKKTSIVSPRGFWVILKDIKGPKKQ